MAMSIPLKVPLPETTAGALVLKYCVRFLLRVNPRVRVSFAENAEYLILQGLGQ